MKKRLFANVYKNMSDTVIRGLKPFKRQLEAIDELRSNMAQESDQHIKNKAAQLSARVRNGFDESQLLLEAFALAAEAARRVLGLNPYDVQVAAGLAMHDGRMVQMETGEGKTLAAVMPVYLNALSRKGVHVHTVNDYLAQRDAQWMGEVYRFLGLSVGFVREGMSTAQRQDAYACDIVYLTAKEAGFDFLRDQLCVDVSQQVQRPFHYVIVDEADSILIDEARIPLVIAGEAPLPPTDPEALTRLIRAMDKDVHYYSDEYSRDVNFTDAGIDYLEKRLGCGNLHDDANNRLLSALNLALQAELLLHRDIDYIVRDGKIELVDEFTGRVAEKRRWPYGLQTAVEAKEGLTLQKEGEILGSITLQHFLQLYPKRAGMTATAETSWEEFETFYHMRCVVIPPNRPCIRTDHPDVVFTHKAARDRALAAEIADVHATGRPLLVGTASVEESEKLSVMLDQARIPHNVLNAKHHEAEAAIVADAGALGAVTISTNMAGRGTDIRLGGADGATHNQVVALGGLYVMGTNRHESRRVDKQLRGRAGRQGDPGCSRFFVSLEDDLMVRYNVQSLIPPKLMPQPSETAIHNPVVANEIARVQRIVEGQNFEIRKTLRQYSFMIEQQRQLVQRRREDVLNQAPQATKFAETSPQRWREYCARVGETVMRQVEKQITLFHLDQCWQQHLDHVSHLREGVHLWTIGGKSPAHEFQKAAIEAFDYMERELETQVRETFERVTITETGIDAEAEGLRGPTSTWTYMVNDNPFGNQFQRLLAGSNSFALATAVVLPMILPVLIWAKIVSVLKKRKKGLKK